MECIPCTTPLGKMLGPFGLGNPTYVLEYIYSMYIYIQDALDKPNFCLPFKIGCAIHLGYQGFLLLTKSSPCNLMIHFFTEKKKMFALNLAFQ